MWNIRAGEIRNKAPRLHHRAGGRVWPQGAWHLTSEFSFKAGWVGSVWPYVHNVFLHICSQWMVAHSVEAGGSTVDLWDRRCLVDLSSF